MIISFNTHYGGLDTSTGYGYAGFNIVQSLQALGHTVPFADPNAPVMLNFTMPYYYIVADGQYTIGYTPWESTKMQDGWEMIMNQCDEVWTTSDLIAEWFAADGVTKPIHVYEHGIEHVWTPRRRRKTGPLKFLHVGEPATRKGGQLVVDAFVDLFKNNPDYSLTIKANGFNTTRVRYGDGMLFRPDEASNNIKIITENIDLEQMVHLYHEHDVLLYPSWGEGFGFIPIQGMASGMPVIFNHKWAPYRKYSVGLDIADQLVPVPHENEGEHPGMIFWPSLDSLKENMLEVASCFQDYADDAYEKAPLIHEEYDWVEVTRRAFDHVTKKFS